MTWWDIHYFSQRDPQGRVRGIIGPFGDAKYHPKDLSNLAYRALPSLHPPTGTPLYRVTFTTSLAPCRMPKRNFETNTVAPRPGFYCQKRAVVTLAEPRRVVLIWPLRRDRIERLY